MPNPQNNQSNVPPRRLVPAVMFLIGALVAGALTLWVLGRAGGGGGAPVTDRHDPARPLPTPRTDWPMHRGGQALRGEAGGELPHQLRMYWRFRTAAPVTSPPVIAGGRAFVGSQDGHVYALDLATGKKAWAFRTGNQVNAAPLILDGRLYVGSVDNTLYCLNAADGSKLWSFQAGDRIEGGCNHYRTHDGRTLVVVGSYDWIVYALDAATGERVWASKGSERVHPAPSVTQGRVAVGGCDGNLRVIDAGSGEAIDALEIGGPITSELAADGDRGWVGAYAGSEGAGGGGTFACVDLARGHIVWTMAVDSPVTVGPALDGERVIFGSEAGRLYCVDRETGEVVWRYALRGGMRAGPVLCGDKVVVAGDDGRLLLLRRDSGEEVWSYQVGSAISSSPAVAGPVVLFGCDDGYVYAFGPAEP